MSEEKIVNLPGGKDAIDFRVENQREDVQQKIDEAKVILFGSYCTVHTYFDVKMVQYWQSQGFSVIVQSRVPARGGN